MHRPDLAVEAEQIALLDRQLGLPAADDGDGAWVEESSEVHWPSEHLLDSSKSARRRGESECAAVEDLPASSDQCAEGSSRHARPDADAADALSASSATVSWGGPAHSPTRPRLSVTRRTAPACGARRVQNLGAGLLETLQPIDGVCHICNAVQQVLGAGREHEAGLAGRLYAGGDAVGRQAMS